LPKIPTVLLNVDMLSRDIKNYLVTTWIQVSPGQIDFISDERVLSQLIKFYSQNRRSTAHKILNAMKATKSWHNHLTIEQMTWIIAIILVVSS
jgi:hypothetical protein